MDDFIFHHHLAECRPVKEATRYLEIRNYADPTQSTIQENALPECELLDFIHQKGKFERPRTASDGADSDSPYANSLRLIVQSPARHPETFSPYTISLPPDSYAAMIKGMKLPMNAVEATAVTGPFFWFGFAQVDDEPCLQIIFRKSDVRKKGSTRGWELVLSHSFRNGETTGFIKGTPGSNIAQWLGSLQSCTEQVAHPLLLPVIMLSNLLSPARDVAHREARDWLHKLEYAISVHNDNNLHGNRQLQQRRQIQQQQQHGNLILGPDSSATMVATTAAAAAATAMDDEPPISFHRELTECHNQALWTPPVAYRKIVARVERAMRCFWMKLPPGRRTAELKRVHGSLMNRLEFYKAKLDGMESFTTATTERLRFQRNAMQSATTAMATTTATATTTTAAAAAAAASPRMTPAVTAGPPLPSAAEHIGAKLDLELAREQRRRAHASKRDCKAMKSLSLMGATFLPGTFLGSMFSMYALDFDPDYETIPPHLWMYFAFSVPLTVVVVLGWMWCDRRERQFANEEADLAEAIERMERGGIAAIPMLCGCGCGAGVNGACVGMAGGGSGGGGTPLPLRNQHSPMDMSLQSLVERHKMSSI